jgi:hypothetical protein
MDIQVVTAVIAVSGVIIGASIQYVFGRLTESAKHFMELKSRAYSDLLQAIASRASSQRHGDKSRQMEFTIALADAKARIAVYGSQHVVQALAELFQKDPILASPEAMSDLIQVVKAMRADTTGERQSELDNQIGTILFR